MSGEEYSTTVSIDRPTLPFNPINPEDHSEWMALCRDPQWKYQKNYKDKKGEEPLYYAAYWDWKEGSIDERDPDHAPQIYEDDMDLMHSGALAPKFVFAHEVQNEPALDDQQVYLRRFISFLCNRFVLLSKPGEDDSLADSSGMPYPGTRYWWRYWDNQENVYQIMLEHPFQDSAGTFPMTCNKVRGEKRPQYRTLEDATARHGMPPGDFCPPDDAPPWMRVRTDPNQPETECTDKASFLDHMWSFTHHGTTRVPLWDANLMILGRLAGVPETKTCRACCNRADQAILRRCARCKLVYYCKDGRCQRKDWPNHKQMCNYFKK